MPLKQTQWTRAYNERAYGRISVTIPKARKAELDAFVKERDESVNGLINKLLRTEMGLTEDEWRAGLPDGGPDTEN